MELLDGVRLTPVQRRIASHIAGQPAEAAYMSSVELAQRAGVSQPSVTRFAAALGFAGYADFQRAIRTIVVPEAPRDAEWPDQNKLQRAVQSSIATLTALHAFLGDPSPVHDAALMLGRSSPLIVYGCRSSAALAQHFAFFARRIRPHVRLLTGGSSEVDDELADARLAGASSVLAIALPRYPREVGRTLRRCVDLGLRLVLITDSPLSPFACLADVVLPAPVSTELVFDTPVAATQVVAVLLEALADVDPADTRYRLDAFETVADQQRTFIDR